MEIFDIVDELGQPTGQTVPRSEAHEKGICHRTAHIWIVRENRGKKQVLLQKRALGKDSFPGCFDTSSAGHIQAGDEPLASALRELSEELGIKARMEDLDFVGNFRAVYEMKFYGKPFRDNEVVFVYAYDKPVDVSKLSLQAEEVECVQWFDLEEVYREVSKYRDKIRRDGSVAGYEKKEYDGKFCVPPEGISLIRAYMRKKYLYQFYGWQQATVPILKEESRPSDCQKKLRGIKTPQDLYDALSDIWCEYTCAPRLRGGWSEENKTLGQCSITGFLVQDLFGGEVYGILRPAGNYHCYNVIDGHTFDLTSEQFGDEVLDYENNPLQLREVHFAKEEKRLRYEWLKARLFELYS